MAGQIESDIKNICLERMMYAVCYSVGMQYLLLVIFLLLVNFSIFHPIQWLGSSFTALFSIYTWIWTTPLISSVLFYGLLLCRTYLAEPTYYQTRYNRLKKTLGRKVGFCFMHGVVGLFTAWLYTKFLSDRYLHLSIKCEHNQYCLNEKYLFLIISGSCSGIFHYFRINQHNMSLTFSVVNLPKYVQIRSYFYSIFYQSMVDTLVPTFFFIFGYLIVRRIIVCQTLYLFDLIEDPLVTSSVSNLLLDLKLIFLVWILTSQIISNMNLMRVLFNIFLTEKHQFPIEKENMSLNVILLHEALSVKTLKIAFQLSSMDLFDLAHSHQNYRRKQIFSLSIPGGHPYNWKNIVTKVLEITINYNKELSAALLKTTTNGNSRPGGLAARNDIPPGRYSDNVLGEKYLLRQYNDSFGIRNITVYNNASMETIVKQSSPLITNRTKLQIGFTQFHEVISQSIRSIKQYIANLPGIYYIFTEVKITKTNYLLSQSQPIVWLIQGIAELATSSLIEDDYGVVQGDLVKIIVTLLELKKTIDSITPLDLGGKKVDRNYISLKNATKRSLYQICTAFGEYMNDLVPDTELLKLLYNFVYYKEM